MKKSFFLILVLGLVFFSRALESFAESQRGTLTVLLSYEEENGKKTAVEGAVLDVVQVAGMDASEGLVSYLLTADFSSVGLKLEEMKASEALQAAQKLEKVCLEKKKNGMQRETDKQGTAVFENLEPGMYLVRQTGRKKTAERFEKIDPYLVAVPQTEKNDGEVRWNYEVETLPKVELIIKNPPETEPAKTSPKPVKPGVKTGDGTRIWGYVLLAAASGGLLVRRIFATRFAA